MNTFKIGDRVKVIKYHAIGKIGIVRGIAKFGYPSILVEFDEDINGHDGNNKCDYKGRKGYCWYYDSEDLELINAIPKFKIGDRVRVQGVPAQEAHRAKYNGLVTTIKAINPNGEAAYGGKPHYSVTGERIYYIFHEIELVPVNEEKIVITTDGKTTVATLYDGDKVVKEAKADCSPDDKFDFTQGAKLAFERLTHTFKFEVGKQYQHGDLIIEITSAERKVYDNRYKFKVVKGSESFCYFDERSVFAEYLKPYEPPQYYNGKVVCVKAYGSWWTVGKVYEVKNGIIIDNDGSKYPREDFQPYKDAEDVRHAGNINGRRHNTENEFIPIVE